ncbi:MAG TPA: hypothetical protein VGH32_09185 [Pirellulales bacterium]
MSSRLVNRLRHVSRDVGRTISDRTSDLTDDARDFDSTPKGAWSLFGIAAAGLLIAGAFYYGPDLVRYLKIKRM